MDGLVLSICDQSRTIWTSGRPNWHTRWNRKAELESSKWSLADAYIVILVWLWWIICVCLRVQLLSDKVMDMLREVIDMKGHLAELRSKCKGAEVFIDNFTLSALGTTKKAGGTGARTQSRRRKVKRPKKKKPFVLPSPALGGKKKAAGRGTQTQRKRGKGTQRYKSRKPVGRSGHSAAAKLRRRILFPRWPIKADRPLRSSSVRKMNLSPFLFVCSYFIYHLSLP